jgi:acyl carrier protein
MKTTKHFEALATLIGPYLPEEVSVAELRPESHLINELNINSAHLVDLILDVEDHFDIRLEDADMQQMETVGDALRIIDQKLQ